MGRLLPKTIALSLAAHAVVAAVLVAPKSTPAVASGDPAPQIAGDTFELPVPETADPLQAAPTSASDPTPTSPPAESPTEHDLPENAPTAADGESQRRTSASNAQKPSTHRPRSQTAPAPSAGANEPAAASPQGTLYGAVGDRSATDLAATFARSFTQTASEDPAWQRAPLGPAGEAVVTLTIDESGHITDVHVGGSPGAALTSSIGRTMALVKARAFIAHGKTTKIQLAATITTGSADDGLDEGRYGISVRNGNASFVLPIGRRIQLRVK